MQSSDCFVKRVYENKNEKNPQQYSPKKTKEKIKGMVIIQYHNQDLDSAIQQLKEQEKSMSFHKDLNQIEKKYQTNPNPPSKKQIFPMTQHLPLFTQSYKRKYQERLQEIKQRRLQIQVKSLEKHMQAKIHRKIKENLELKKKMQLLKDINEKKEQNIRLKESIEKRKKDEHQLIHQSYQDFLKMMRKTKTKVHQKEIKDSRTVELESWKEMKFKDYIEAMERKQRSVLNQARLQFIRTPSQGKFRTKKIKNSSELTRDKLKSAANLRKAE